jgi:hypothetical protein
VYVFVVVVSPAVTTIWIWLLVAAVSDCAPDALPDATSTVATVTVAADSVVPGISTTDSTPFATVAVYDVTADEKAGLRVTADINIGYSVPGTPTTGLCVQEPIFNDCNDASV